MDYLPAAIFGIRLFYSDMCLKTITLPARQYQKKRWQTMPQAIRKQKKWIKRWGFVKEPCIYKTQNGFFAHPSFKPQLEAALAREQIIKRYRDSPFVYNGY